MRRALVIVGKAPRAGQTKTRLVPPLSYAEAAELSDAFLRDTILTGLGLGWECVTLVHPAMANEAELLAERVPAGVRLCAQTGAGLGDALRGAFAGHFDAGFERVVLVGSDSPTLPRSTLEAACDALDACDVSIGPSVDGGYYALGLRQPCGQLFRDITWSTSRVFEQTLDQAVGLRVVTLAEWYDVDVPRDLIRLRDDLLMQAPDVAVYTRAALERLTLNVASV